MARPTDEALHRALIRAEKEGCTPAGHSAMLEAATQIGDRMTGIDCKMDQVLDILHNRGGAGSVPTLVKWIAAVATAIAGAYAGYKGANP